MQVREEASEKLFRNVCENTMCREKKIVLIYCQTKKNKKENNNININDEFDFIPRKC